MAIHKKLCKIDVDKHHLCIMYDYKHMILTKDKYYLVNISEFRISVTDDNNIYFHLGSLEYFYSDSELRKIKIKNILK